MCEGNLPYGACSLPPAKHPTQPTFVIVALLLLLLLLLALTLLLALALLLPNTFAPSCVAVSQRSAAQTPTFQFLQGGSGHGRAWLHP